MKSSKVAPQNGHGTQDGYVLYDNCYLKSGSFFFFAESSLPVTAYVLHGWKQWVRHLPPVAKSGQSS